MADSDPTLSDLPPDSLPPAQTGPLPASSAPDDLVEAGLIAETAETLTRLADHITRSGQAGTVAAQLATAIHPKARRATLGGLWRGRYSVEERRNAIRLIRLLQQPVEVEPFIATMWDRDADIRLEAATALAEIGLWLDWSSPEMAHVIHAMTIALRHQVPEIRQAAARGLARISAYEAIGAIGERIEVEKDAEVKEALVLALGRLNSAEAVLPVLDSYESAEIDRQTCLDTLLALSEGAIEPLISVVRRWNVRAVSREVAAEALGLMGTRAALGPLIVILSRPHEPNEVRIAAARALARIGSRQALPVLHWVLREWALSRAVSEAISEAIARFNEGPDDQNVQPRLF